jgi:hypothetical protein
MRKCDGILSGFPDGGFHPDSLLTREEAMAMTARAAGLIGADDPLRFLVSCFLLRDRSDDVSRWALDAASFCVFKG